MATDQGAHKRPREEIPEIDSPEEKRLRYEYEYDELLLNDILEESDPDQTVQDLDSVIKSLEEEISISNPAETGSGLVVPEFGYLLEASDDELGLPPSTAADGGSVEARELFGLGENWGFEEDTEFLAAEFGFVDGGDGGGGGEYLLLDGLFQYSDPGFGLPEFSWRSESNAGPVM